MLHLYLLRRAFIYYYYYYHYYYCYYYLIKLKFVFSPVHGNHLHKRQLLVILATLFCSLINFVACQVRLCPEPKL